MCVHVHTCVRAKGRFHYDPLAWSIVGGPGKEDDPRVRNDTLGGYNDGEGNNADCGRDRRWIYNGCTVGYRLI